MTGPLLNVQGLKTVFRTPEGVVRAVDGVDLDLKRGETLALLGESGCGKSMTALSLLRLIPEPAGRIVAGHVRIGETDILALPERDMRRVRGRRLAMIFQEPQTSLNPVLTIGEQIKEALPDIATSSNQETRKRVTELLLAVGMADPERRYDTYPHELSGGMKQRVMIAIALATEPDILVADEPTTALDVTLQAQILELLKEIQRRTGMGLLLITHDLGVVAQLADRVAVMYAGQIVEVAPRNRFFSTPLHPYSLKLFRSLPGRLKRGEPLEVIAGSVPSLATEFRGCRFVDRCDRAHDACRERPPAWTAADAAHGVRCHLYEPGNQAPPAVAASPVPGTAAAPIGHVLLSVTDLAVHFPVRRGVWQRVAGYVKAVDGISFAIRRGQTLALVGESGCGKTTAGKALLRLVPSSTGRIHFGGQDLASLNGGDLRRIRRRMQIIFQDPYGSLDPRMRVSEIVEEGMRAQDLGGDRARRRARVEELLGQVGLPPAATNRYPHEFSGGQRQRLSIARALAVEPELIVCDEPTSALDVSVQAQILNLLRRLQEELQLSYLFITHNLSVVEYLAHEVAVMYLGRIVERGRVEEILDRPVHPYTQALLSAVPGIDIDEPRTVIRLSGDIPSPARPPAGCHFHPRCPRATDICRSTYPVSAELSDTHRVSCHHGNGV